MKKIFFLTILLLLIVSTFFGLSSSSITNRTHFFGNILKSLKPPTVDFTFTNNSSCSGTPITFTPNVSGTAPFSYSWNFGDGASSTNSSPSHSFTALGCGFRDFTVGLTVTDGNGEATTITKTIAVQEKPNLNFINLNAPAGSSAPFEKCGDNNSDTDYTINVGNNSASTACISSYNIDWGDGNSETNVTFPLSHTYMQLGSFNMTITAIGTAGCNNNITYVVKNSNNPIGALIAPGNTTNLCTPVQPMYFAIGSWASNPSDTNYSVNYGDGTVVNYTQTQLEASIYYDAANPPNSQDFPIPHTFTSFNCPSGDIVTLTITTSCGSTYLTAGPIIILDVPVVSFNVNSIACANTSVYFNNTTIAGFTNDCSTFNVYTWDFGDGTPVSRQVNPSHVYTAPGNYTITLSAETPCGSGGSVTRTICVEPILEPDFTFGNACTGEAFQITNTTDTSQSCGSESYFWEVVNYIEAYCGEEPASWNFTNGTNSNSRNPAINFNKPGIYYLRLRTRNSCGIDRTITKQIHVKTRPQIELDTISDFCESATINPVGRVLETCSPPSEITYLWSFPGGSPSSSTSLNPGSINYSASGNYTATFSVTNSCGTTSVSRTFTVDLVLSPIIQDKTQEICSGDTFSINPFSNGTDNVPSGTTYTWGNPIVSPAGSVGGASAQNSPRGNISQSLTNTTNAASTVTYTVSPIAGSCPGPDFKVVITVYPTISVSPIINNNTCFESDDGSIDINISGGIPFPTGSPFSISWTGPNGFTSSDEDISNLEPGYYNLEIIGDDNGFCPFNDRYYVGEPGQFRFTGNVPRDITCFGANDGFINLNIAGGNQPYSYIWTKDGSPFSFTGEDPQNLGPGVYTVEVRDANNCDPNPLTDSFTIIEPPLLEVNLVKAPDIILCYGDFTGEIDVEANGGRPFNGTDYQWSWTGPNGFRSSNQNLRNIESGTYNLTVTDSSGCTKQLSVFVDQNPQLMLDYTVQNLTCYNDDTGSISVNNITGGIPPYEPLVWSNLGTGFFQDNLSARIYYITVTDSLGCSRIFPIEVENAPVFEINPDVQNVSCYGQNDAFIKLNLVGGEPPVTIVWSDGAAAGDERNNIGPGTYDVTITDAKGCIITDSFTIREPQELKLIGSITDALDCDDVNSGAIDLEITGGTLPLTISWSNGSYSEDLLNIPPDNYIATITDANGCIISETFEVKRFNPLEAPFDVITNFDCETRHVDQTFKANVMGGVPPYSLTWSNANSPFVTISGTNNEVMNTDENGLVILTVVDGLGCVEDFSIQVDKPVLDDARFETSSLGFDLFGIYSIKDPILFTNLATGSIETISWDFGDGNFSNEESPSHSYTTPGTYTITHKVTYTLGCIYTRSITLIVEKGYSLMMPNAFTPNQDNMNDFFAPEFIGLDNMRLDVYDTWGSMVYSETNNDIEGWNGEINGAEAENGNYYYKFSAKTFYGDTITAEGVFVLIK